MPNIKSAKKRVLVSKSKATRNKSQNSALKTAIKKANAAATNSADKEAAVKAAMITVDKACAKGLIHKNNAARKKSTLAKLLNEA
ncbi:MAG: 30S ribosomal protein S20 [Clostridiales bacterium]|nr:30S ribosomal protein S20 [Clostridiales bacterium]